jgi:hypothetical protein
MGEPFGERGQKIKLCHRNTKPASYAQVFEWASMKRMLWDQSGSEKHPPKPGAQGPVFQVFPDMC